MIGPGTGVAPFLAFLRERAARGARGANWLFFGEQRRATDYYYADELTTLRERGVLRRLDLAFSRDQRNKVYVQDRIREHGAHLWGWLQDGAYLYVCGDATRMAKDVDQALRDVAAAHGQLTPTPRPPTSSNSPPTSATAATSTERRLTGRHRPSRRSPGCSGSAATRPPPSAS
nr:hypothetical protein [Phytohabitans flavus]